MSIRYDLYLQNHKEKVKRGFEWLQAKFPWLFGGRFKHDTLVHHGVKGQKWGVRNGPPYPLDKSNKRDTIVKDAIDSGQVSKKINREKQMRHTKTHHTPGRSYLDGDLDFAQELVDEYGGKGEPLVTDDGRWLRKEKIKASSVIGTHVDENGNERKTDKAMIVYSKTGTHVYPRKETK